MTIVLVHGVPETPAVWDPLRSSLRRSDVEALRLPGFGCPRPARFDATKEAYVDWLVAELERLNARRPVDVVGHDWGGGFVVRVVSTRPELVRSWITDAAGVGDADFEWHDIAKLWQTPGAGEQSFERLFARPNAKRAAAFEQVGVPRHHALAMSAAIDETMASCILALYRSAVDVGKEWAPDFADVPAPGLVIVPSEDPYLAPASARNGARRAGAGIAELAGLGHWWMLQDPAQGAAVLERFWASLR